MTIKQKHLQMHQPDALYKWGVLFDAKRCLHYSTAVVYEVLCTAVHAMRMCAQSQ